jgi:hypothetical protein
MNDRGGERKGHPGTGTIMVLYLNIFADASSSQAAPSLQYPPFEGQQLLSRQYRAEGSKAGLFWNIQGNKTLSQGMGAEQLCNSAGSEAHRVEDYRPKFPTYQGKECGSPQGPLAPGSLVDK